jgi:ParB-like chromosome segregation protein Spo0J
MPFDKELSGMAQQVKRIRFETIPVTRLVKDPMNPRRNVGDLQPLIRDISEHGFLSSVTVRPLPDGNYGVVRGSRRVEAARVAGEQSLSCVVVEGLSDTEALIWSLQDEHTSLPLSDEEYYEAVVELRRRLGSLRRVAETLGEPFESIRGLVEKMEGRRVLEDEGIQVVDKRTKQAISLKGVKKTTAAQFIKAVKRLSKLEKKKTAEQEKEEAAPSPTLPSPEEAVKMLEWQPKLFKAVEQGPFLHEQLKRPETLLSAPRDVRALMELVSPDNTPFPSYFPVVRLNPPFDNIRVLLCPRCLSLLRGLGHGSLVACLECGFPNHDVWKAV